MSDRYTTLDRTLASHFDVLYERQKLRNSAASTRKQFRINIQRFGRYLGRQATLDDLTDDMIADLMAWMAKAGKAPRTCNKFRSNMLALWRFLARKKIVSEWPDVDAMLPPERIPIAWTPEQLKKLWESCEAQTGALGGVPANLWWHALHSLAWDTGERIMAVRTARWQFVDLDRGWIVIKAESRKGRRADKLSRLHPDTVAALTRIRRGDGEDVFPWPFDPTYIWKRYKRLLRGAGLPFDRDHMFHCLRRSVASYFEAAGGNATKLFGHSARKVTVQHYLDPRISPDVYPADLLFRPGKKR